MTLEVSSNVAKRQTHCRICDCPLQKVLELGDQPLANSYLSLEQLEQEELTVPLNLMYCVECTLAQLEYVVNPDLMFKNYLYVSGTTKTLKDHFRGLATVSRNFLKKTNFSPRILDIACNDGTALKQFQAEFPDAELWGVDPAENLIPIATKNLPDAHIVQGYWGNMEIIPIDYFDIITASNVFAHVDDVVSFLEACKRSLKRDGTLFIEMPYFMETMKKGEFDQIYHEHLSYFSYLAMQRLCFKVGLYIIKTEFVPIHGGTIRFALSMDPIPSSNISLMLEEHRNRKLVYTFVEDVERRMRELKCVIDKAVRKGIPVVGYGASAKGNTVINFGKLTNISYIVDDNPGKVGLYTPGAHIPIEEVPTLGFDGRPLAIIMFAWNFREEILQKIESVRGNLPTYIIDYVPDVSHELLNQECLAV